MSTRSVRMVRSDLLLIHGRFSFRKICKHWQRLMTGNLYWIVYKGAWFLFSQYSGDFVAVDVSALRGTFAPNCIPPPGWVPSPVEEVFDDDVDDVEHTFICDCTLADGRPCQQGFPTAQALAVHKSSTKGGTHDNLSDISKVSITNKCPWCKNVFSSVLSARNHIRGTLGRGYCGGTGSHVVFEVQQPESLQCRVCEVCGRLSCRTADSKCSSIGPLASRVAVILSVRVE